MRFRKWLRVKRLCAFGAPIYLHWSVLAAAAVVAALSVDSPASAAVSVTSYLAIIVIHELGHAYVAKRRGHRVLAIHIAFFHGRCEYEAPDYEWDDVAIAWGGVLAQLLVAIPLIVLDFFLNPAKPNYLDSLIGILGYLNLIIALFNLVPATPFDGATAWRIVPLIRAKRTARRDTERVLQHWRRK
jgi:Zn-dependent protease